MDESRKQFEEWMTDMGKHPLAIEKVDGNYILASARTQWEAWKASREAIEIKLPTENELHQKVCSECASESLEMVEQAVRAAGIKVKE